MIHFILSYFVTTTWHDVIFSPGDDVTMGPHDASPRRVHRRDEEIGDPLSRSPSIRTYAQGGPEVKNTSAKHSKMYKIFNPF